MNTVLEIERAIRALSPDELAELYAWMDENGPVDDQIKTDLDAGRFDDRIARALADELVRDAVMGFFEELTFTRETLERRYRDLESGSAQPIDGEEAYRRLMAKTEERRLRPA